MVTEREETNTISIGEIALSSSNLPIDELIGRVISMLQDATIKSYLENLANRKLIGTSKSYVS